jgi:hypothetical protein
VGASPFFSVCHLPGENGVELGLVHESVNLVFGIRFSNAAKVNEA